MAYPSTRQATYNCYHSGRSETMMYGGVAGAIGGGGLTQLWTRSSATQLWTQQTPSAAAPARYDGRAAARTVDGLYYLFGGRDGGSYYQDLYKLDPAGVSGWTFSLLAPVTKPATRAYMNGLTYDPVRDELVLAGGYNGSIHNDTYTYPFTTANWVLKSPAHAVTARASGHQVWDSVRSVTVLIAGDTATTLLMDTWEWNGTDWTDRTSSGTLPPVRRYHFAWFDSSANQIFLFAGCRVHNADGTSAAVATTDLWSAAWDASTSQYRWTQLTSTAWPYSPPGRCLPGVSVFDTLNSKGYILHGLDAAATPQDGGAGWSYDGVAGIWSPEAGTISVQATASTWWAPIGGGRRR